MSFKASLIIKALSSYASITISKPFSSLQIKFQKSFQIKSSSSEKNCLTLSCFHSFHSQNLLYAVANLHSILVFLSKEFDNIANCSKIASFSDLAFLLSKSHQIFNSTRKYVFFSSSYKQ
jgi:hypothetical protein